MKNFLLHISFVLFFILFSANLQAQTTIGRNAPFFKKANDFFAENVKNNLVDYAKLKNDASLKSLIGIIKNTNLSKADKATKQAFYINAYNLLVIDAATKQYPIPSVLGNGGFFDRKKVQVAGKSITLNTLEKEYLLKKYKDPRFHFVLVCGAISCPPITNFAYHPDKLEEQLHQQTKRAINDPHFLQQDGKKVALSQIFKWYAADFGGTSTKVLQFINQYRNKPISSNSKITYYQYDWSLNDYATKIKTNSRSSATSSTSTNDANNAQRYVVSSAIPKGTIELKWFNNLYTQKTGTLEQLTDRATFFTSSLSFLYGWKNRINIGLQMRYRHVRNANLPTSALGVFTFENTPDTRQALTSIGPQIRLAPFPKLTNFSIQSAFLFATQNDLAGNATQPYIDWNGPTWNTQFFNDFSIGSQFSLFTEIDFLIEDIGKKSKGHVNRFSTPLTTILSYFPHPKITLYTLGSFSPYWQSEFDYFYQLGLGAKYQYSPKVEFELLFTDFTNKFLHDTGGKAATYNLGFRFSI